MQIYRHALIAFPEVNVFSGILNNSMFCGILVTTAVLQVLIVEFGSVAFAVADGGLDGRFWLLSLIIGAGSLPVQQIINVVYMLTLGGKSNDESKSSPASANGSHS